MILDKLQTLLLDGDGVLWHGDEPVPGLQRFFTVLNKRAIRWGLLTNNATRNIAFLADRFKKFGVNVDSGCIFTSALATADYLVERLDSKKTVYVVGESGLQEALQDAGFTVDMNSDDTPHASADAVVVGLDRQFSYGKLGKAMRLIRDGAMFVATNTDNTFPSSSGLVPGAGPIVQAVATASDRQPIIIGKPSAPLFEVALKRLRANLETTAMLGDRLETDIVGARQLHLGTILVLSGVSSREDIAKTQIEPDLVFNNIDELAQEFENLPVQPA
jgi:4-nitrophenyl phosphatase